MKSTTAPKLCSLPPTTEAFEQNVRRAHHQVALWHSALSGDPPAPNSTEHGWEADDINRRLIPRNMADGVSYAPDHILKLVRCGCSSKRPCMGGNCSCMGHQLVCTMFVLVAVDLPVQAHSMLESLKLMWMTAKKIVRMTIMMVIIHI